MSAKKNDNIKKATKAPVKAPVKAADKASGKTTTKMAVKATTKKAPVKKAVKPATSSARRAKPATSSARRPESEYVISKAAYQRSWKYIVDINSESKERLDRVALIDMERTYTYRQMFRNWEKYAEVFSALGITEANHSRLAIFDCSCIESSFAVYAANMTGASIAGFTPAYLSEKFPLAKAIKEEGITDLFINDLAVNKRLLIHALKIKAELGLRNVIVVKVPIDSNKMDPGLVSFSNSNYKEIKTVDGALFMDDLIEKYEGTPISYGKKTNDPSSFVFHTSGTTKGISKPSPLSDEALNLASENMKKSRKFVAFEKGCVTLCTMVATSVYGFVNQLHEPLAFGCSVVLLPMANQNPFFVKSISHYKINAMFVTPFYFEAWSKLPKDFIPDFSSVNAVIIGGAYLSAEARKRYSKFMEANGAKDVKFVNGYGMSETCGACIIQTEEVDNDSIGFPLPGVDLKIYDEIDEKFYSVKDKHTGVLYIHSDSLSSGKIDNNEFFKLDEIDGVPYICTNDVVSVNKDGSISCQGRANRYFVNNDGIKFNAGIIENQVASEEGIEACAMTPWYDKLLTHDTVPVLYVQPVSNDKNAAEIVKNALVNVFIKKGTAKESNLPMQCVIAQQIPHNRNGKVDIYRITNGGVAGDRYIIRPVRVKNDLKDIVLELTQNAEEGITNGEVPVELSNVWDDIRESTMDKTVLNQAANQYNARLMSLFAGAHMMQGLPGIPGLSLDPATIGQFVSMLQNAQNQFISFSSQYIQYVVSEYNNWVLQTNKYIQDVNNFQVHQYSKFVQDVQKYEVDMTEYLKNLWQQQAEQAQKLQKQQAEYIQKVQEYQVAQYQKFTQDAQAYLTQLSDYAKKVQEYQAAQCQKFVQDYQKYQAQVADYAKKVQEQQAQDIQKFLQSFQGQLSQQGQQPQLPPMAYMGPVAPDQSAQK